MTRASSVPTAEAGQRLETSRPNLAQIHLEARHMQSQAIAEGTAIAMRKLAHVTGLRKLSHALGARLRRWHGRRRTIATLRRLDNRTLQDIGIDSYDIEATVDRLMAPSFDQDRAQLGQVIGQVESRLSGDARRRALERRAHGLLPRQVSDVLPDLAFHRRGAFQLRKPAVNGNGEAGRKAA